MTDQLEQDKADILAALEYRSGPDSCNSVYMGSMATASVYHAMGLNYGEGDLVAAIKSAGSGQIANALDACRGVIRYMKMYPTTTCPTCGTRGVTIRGDKQ